MQSMMQTQALMTMPHNGRDGFVPVAHPVRLVARDSCRPQPVMWSGWACTRLQVG